MQAFMQKFSKYFNSIAKKDDNDEWESSYP